MTWIAPKLDKRVDICIPIQTPDSEGGVLTSFEKITTVWSGFSPIDSRSPLLKYIRGMQVEAVPTHIFTIRNCALEIIKNKTNEVTLNPVKSNYFIFLYQGNGGLIVGRRFKIMSFVDNKEEEEYTRILAQELSEEGTGYDNRN